MPMLVSMKMEMTSDSGGKGRVIEYLKSKYGYQRLIMIGDGATDMEANADGFIGFGGHVVREKVRDGSAWFVTSFYALIDELRNNSLSNVSHHQPLTTPRKYSIEIEAN